MGSVLPPCAFIGKFPKAGSSNLVVPTGVSILTEAVNVDVAWPKELVDITSSTKKIAKNRDILIDPFRMSCFMLPGRKA
jgi:hypothetical protein